MTIQRYCVTLNWKGELHTVWTQSSSVKKAMISATVTLARKLDLTPYSVRQYFIEDKCRWKVERR